MDQPDSKRNKPPTEQKKKMYIHNKNVTKNSLKKPFELILGDRGGNKANK